MDKGSRYDLLQPIENKQSGKTYWNKIGTMFDNGEDFTLIFSAIPMQTYSDQYGLQLRAFAKKPLPKDGNGYQNDYSKQQAKGNVAAPDDDIPF